LLVEPARRAPNLRFVVAGPQYPGDIAWPANVERIEHVPPRDHAEFYAACRFTLNVTRADMIRAGYSPSVRLFEAAATGTPIISDVWAGLDTILAPGREIVTAADDDDVLAVLKPVLGHRVIMNPDAILRGENMDQLLERVTGAVKPPVSGKGRKGLRSGEDEE